MSTIGKPLCRGFTLGRHRIDTPLVLAPMAGITDLPFRRICRRFGVGLMVSEMIASRAIDARRHRSEQMGIIGEDEHPIAIQIAGSDPAYMRMATQWAIDHGADFVDINMGCPVKKVCKQLAGSAMLKDEALVARVLEAVVGASSIPVTLKIRTGWDEANKNVGRIARIAEECGIAMLTVHGRTRVQMFDGHANWEDIGLAKQAVSIPVIGNGDVVDGASAREMLRISGCDGVMVGRAVQGNPWVLAEVKAAMNGEATPPGPAPLERWKIVREHFQLLAEFHGPRLASQLVRKHAIWYSRGLPESAAFRRRFNTLNCWDAQLEAAESYFTRPAECWLADAA